MRLTQIPIYNLLRQYFPLKITSREQTKFKTPNNVCKTPKFVCVYNFIVQNYHPKYIRKPKHIMEKSLCIDLRFTSDSKLLFDVRAEQTIYDKCNHIICRSLNLNIPLHLQGSLGLQKHRSDLYTACKFVTELECSL